MLGGSATNEISGTFFGDALQVSYYMEWYCRKNRKAFGKLEESIFVKGREIDVDPSTLSNLPTYYLSLFPIPMGVEAKYDSLSGG